MPFDPFEIFVDQAVSDAYSCYTMDMNGSNLDRVSNLAAQDLIKNWGPELASAFAKAIKAKMEADLDEFRRNR